MRVLCLSAVLSLSAVQALQLGLHAARTVPHVSMSSALPRRKVGQDCAVLAFGVLSSCLAGSAGAEEAFSKLGGLLEPYIDTQKGYKLYKPSGWNQFEADPGVYDMKWQDIIEANEIVQVSSSPVSTATSVSALGELKDVGDKFAASRSAKLIDAKQREADGSLVYTFELQGESIHEYVVLSVNRGKLFRVSCVTSNKRWPKRAELYKNIVLSFVPKGF